MIPSLQDQVSFIAITLDGIDRKIESIGEFAQSQLTKLLFDKEYHHLNLFGLGHLFDAKKLPPFQQDDVNLTESIFRQISNFVFNGCLYHLFGFLRKIQRTQRS